MVGSFSYFLSPPQSGRPLTDDEDAMMKIIKNSLNSKYSVPFPSSALEKLLGEGRPLIFIYLIFYIFWIILIFFHFLLKEECFRVMKRKDLLLVPEQQQKSRLINKNKKLVNG